MHELISISLAQTEKLVEDINGIISGEELFKQCRIMRIEVFRKRLNSN